MALVAEEEMLMLIVYTALMVIGAGMSAIAIPRYLKLRKQLRLQEERDRTFMAEIDALVARNPEV